MKWFEITVFTRDEALDCVCARMDMLGLTQVVIQESREHIQRELTECAKYWDYADMDAICTEEPCVKAYIADCQGCDDVIDSVRASFAALKKEDVGLDTGSLRVVVRTMDDEDWANNWKLYYKPTLIGERLLICPSWEEAQCGPDRVVLRIDPGMAFGTGTHHTTRMCLELLEKNVRAGDLVADLGCGSGILSIAALLLGAEQAEAVDIDPITEKIATENAALNGLGTDRFHIHIGDLICDAALGERLHKNKYRVVCANIVASVIIALSELVPTLLDEDGVFIASGVISGRLAEVQKALADAGLESMELCRSEDWCAILARKKVLA